MALTPSQISTLEIIERTNASISVLSTLTLLTTFACLPAFRSLSNTLIFYASFANLFANIAALMGRSAVSNPGGGWCQFQGFLLQMFMQSDPLWSCAMAINVYLCFFRRFTPSQLKRMNWIYGLLCYGIPAIPAIFCLFYRENGPRGRGRIYGDATLWCWIGNEYSDVRIYSYYLPIWIAILISLTIYLRVGLVLNKVRKELRAFEYGIEEATSHRRNSTRSILSRNGRRISSPLAIFTDQKKCIKADVETEHLENIPSHPQFENNSSVMGIDAINSPASSYFPARLQAHAQHDEESTQPSTPPSSPSTLRPTPHSTSLNITYAKSALLFTASILITWVPASVNRVHALVHPGQVVFGLQAASAFVLPLQGFWNCIIFFSSSWGVVKKTLAGREGG